MARTRKTMGRSRLARTWMPAAAEIRFLASADELVDVRPLLSRTLAALGTTCAARVLGVDRAQVARWRNGKLHAVLARILRLYRREAAEMWLTGSEPLLGGARPVDVLVLEGAAPVIRAIDGIGQGVFV